MNRVWYEGKDAKYFRRVDVARWVMTFIIGVPWPTRGLGAAHCAASVSSRAPACARTLAAVSRAGVMTALTAVLITYVSSWLGKVKFTAVAKVIGT